MHVNLKLFMDNTGHFVIGPKHICITESLVYCDWIEESVGDQFSINSDKRFSLSFIKVDHSDLLCRHLFMPSWQVKGV